MKMKFVFDEWRNKKGKQDRIAELICDEFHAGTTFEGEIKLDADNEAELRLYLEAGFQPVFRAMKD